MRRVVEIALFEDPQRLTAFYDRALEAQPAERWPAGGRLLEFHRPV